ncbi:RHS repeat domain-containing protein [Blastopirellula marina]|uniref:RHS repeat domain-containing protein n=1 Tax=Blastopirellula marina TaxID=124 RepID=UPI000315135E|nr:RHS repeat-associated core domain-containing protein [Blastopirellula marina]
MSRKSQGKEENVSRANYTYYGENEDHGCKGDLKTVQFEFWNEGWKSRKDTLQYFAYYTDKNSPSASNSTYAQGMLKAMVGADAYHRMKEAGKDPLKNGPEKYFSDLWIEYYSDDNKQVIANNSARATKQLVRRIKSITLDRNGRTFEYKYEFSETKNPEEVGSWFSTSTETLPNSAQTLVSSNAANETQVHILHNDVKLPVEAISPIRRSSQTYAFYRPRFGELKWISTPNTGSKYFFYPSGEVVQGYSRSGLCIVIDTEASSQLVEKVRIVNDNPQFVSGAIASGANETQENEADPSILHTFSYDPREKEGITFYYLTNDENPNCDLSYWWTWGSSGLAGASSLSVNLPPVPRDENGDAPSASTETVFNQFGLPKSSTDERGVKTSASYYDELSVPKKIVTRSLEGEVLTTDLRADQLGRITRALGPIHRAVTSPDSTRTERIRRANWTIFDDLEGVAISAVGFQRAGGDFQVINPVSASQFDRSGRIRQQINAMVRNTNAPDRIRASDLASARTWCRSRVLVYNDKNQLKEEQVYYDIAAGKSFTTYFEAYDEMYNLTNAVTPDGTRWITQYNMFGQPEKIWLGAKSAETLTTEFRYDNEKPNFDNPVYIGNLTSVTRYAKPNEKRVLKMVYDWKNQLHRQEIVKDEEQQADSAEEFFWDLAGRLKIELIEKRQGISNFSSATVPKYDSRGFVYRKNYLRQSQATPSNLELVEQMTDLIWRDQSGNAVKYRPAGSLGYFKMQYDSLGREKTRFWAYNERANSPLSQAIQFSVADLVLEKSDTEFDPLGQPRQVTVQHTGPTQQNSFRGLNELPENRTEYAQSFFDPLGRVVASVDYGTGQPMGGDSIPPSTDYTLVTRYVYNVRGELALVQSPSGKQVQTEFDDAGRAITTTELQGQIPQRFTRNQLLPDGRIKSIIVRDPRRGTDQTVVRLLYGPENSDISFYVPDYSLVAKKIDADGAATSFGYNLQGEVIGMQDPRGDLHEYLYDEYGRQTDDIVHYSGPSTSEVDNTTSRITRVFDDLGRLIKIQTFADADGKIELTSVDRSYTAFNQVNQETTSITGYDSKSTSIQFVGLSDLESPDEVARANTIRPTQLEYPSQRSIRYEYASHADNDTGRITRIQFLTKSQQPLFDYASYVYWGSGQIYQVRLGHSTSDGLVFNLDFPSGKRFGALDSLDRLQTLRWVQSGDSPTLLLQFKYQHDRNYLISNREMRSTAGVVQRDQFVYDGLNRLKKFTRQGQDQQEQSWSLDALGNWRKWDTRNGASEKLLQSRTYGPGDRIKSLTNASQETPWAQPEYDEAGNLTACPNPQQPEVTERVTYDAWNRPVKLTSSLTRLTYDGLGRLALLSSGAEKRRFTYSPDWRLLEEVVTPQEGGSYRYEYIWGIRGQDDLICRERYSDLNHIQERLYSLSDANGNTVRLIPEDDESLDRLITYDPYGAPSNQGDFRQLFGGYYYDSNTGLYVVRNRVYHPKLGRWLTKDPLGMVDGPNLYEYCAGDPVNFIDPSGTVFLTALTLSFLGTLAYAAATTGAEEGPPEFYEGLAPLWGPSRSAGYHFSKGEWVWGTLNAIIAVGDVFLVSSLLRSGGRAFLTLGAKTLGRELASDGIRTAGKEATEAALREIAHQQAGTLSFRAKLFVQNLSGWAGGRLSGRTYSWVTRSQIDDVLEKSIFELVQLRKGSRFLPRVDPITGTEGLRIVLPLGGKWLAKNLAGEIVQHELLHVSQFLRNPALGASQAALRNSRYAILKPRFWYEWIIHESFPSFIGSPHVYVPPLTNVVIKLPYEGGWRLDPVSRARYR